MIVPPQLFLIPFVLVESGARSLYFFVNLAQADNLFQFFPYSSILAVLHPTLFPPNFYLLAYQFILVIETYYFKKARCKCFAELTQTLQALLLKLSASSCDGLFSQSVFLENLVLSVLYQKGTTQQILYLRHGIFSAVHKLLRSQFLL